MEKYIKCPRCEINYILEKQKLCDICKAELKLAPDIYSEEDEDMILCPICKTNYIFPEEDMCSTCRNNGADSEEVKEVDIESDEEWRTFLDDDKEEDDVIEDGDISLSELQEDEEEKYEDDYDEYADDYDDNFDDIEDDDLDDFDDEEEEDEDDE